MASAREVIDRHVAAFAAKDPDAEPWSEDAKMVTPAGRFEGRDQVLGFLKVFWNALPDARLEITRSIEDGALAAAEGMLTARRPVPFRHRTEKSRLPAGAWNFAGWRCTKCAETSSPPSTFTSIRLIS